MDAELPAGGHVRHSKGVPSPPPAPKFYLEILHLALLVEKEKEELRKRERRGGDSILFLNNKHRTSVTN